MKKFFEILILMLFTAGWAAAGDIAEQGKPAPDFTLEDLDGNKRSLSDFRGKVVLLNFWWMSCAPCKQEMPSMELLYRKFKDDGLVVLTVNCVDSKKVLKWFVKETGYTFLILLDKGDKVRRSKYPSRGVPHSVIIDRDGIVRDIKPGFTHWMDENKWLPYFKKFLKEER